MIGSDHEHVMLLYDSLLTFVDDSTLWKLQLPSSYALYFPILAFDVISTF